MLNRKTKYFPKILLFVLLLCNQQVFAQLVLEHEGKKEPLENMILQVKQLDEFISRFNYKNDFHGKPVSPDFERQFPREKYIGLLFDNEDSRIKNGSKEHSDSYIHLKNQFIDELIQNNGKFINPLSDKIYAITECLLLYKNKEVKARLILNRYIGTDYVKWVIQYVDADFMELKTDKAALNSLPPNSHETDFISLKKALDKKVNLQNIADKEFDYNQLSVFLYLVSMGDIKFQYVEKLKFIIMDINGWAITISNFNRNSENSGWLISNLNVSNTSNVDYSSME